MDDGTHRERVVYVSREYTVCLKIACVCLFPW